TEPTATNCWDDYQFNTTSCTWENQGSQPTEPTATNCWDDYQFNTTSCTWVNQGSQPTEPTATNCWDDYQFNTTSCTWVNQGSQPTEPTATNCWDDYQFNTTSCNWENQGSQPTEPTATNCWDDYQFNTTSCTWENQGSQPTEPTATNCWDDYQFNTTSCTWVNQGSQPTEPTATNCWDDYQFNTTSCTWVNQGSQPTEPTTECWETATFNNTTCSWDVTDDGDNINPVCIVQDITVELDGTGNVTISANQIDNGSSDDCAINTMSVSPNTFDTNDIGDNNVVFTITDNSGNISTCNATVTVTENTLGTVESTLEDVTVQPNPFNTHIRISLPTNFNGDKYSIKLFDINGRVVYNQILTSTNGEITIQNIDELQQGSYFIKIVNSNTGNTIVKKLLKF
ncbi:T9SS type A sorting domain-containing protein, partial [Hanstruepera ponticola]|uniref:T9SS type A sorting domain-containing protein n=1 Tax=Hanstruepera ponticola TaxID=2042995 RepID=UPI00177AA110